MVTSQALQSGVPARPAAWHAAAKGALLVALALAAALALASVAGLPVVPPALALALGSLGYAAGVTALLWHLRRYYALPAFGACNQVTLLRMGLVCLLAGLVATPGALAAPALAWTALALAGLALALDGADGFLARRAGLVSRFGARFDMEVDAALILVLAVLAAQTGKAGVWVLALGLIRYAFVAGGTFLPWLRAALPESLRRKTVCVLQVVVLTALLAPPLVSPLSDLAALAALAALVWSFAVDILWLWRNRHEPRGAS